MTLWGGRLAWHIAKRSGGHGEDPRYEEMLGGPGWHAGAVKVLLRVFLTQAVVAFLISFPLVVAAAYDVLVVGGRVAGRGRVGAGHLLRGGRRRPARGVPLPPAR